jgi:hypothetical protein
MSEPFELLLALAALVSGGPVAWGAARPESMASQLPAWVVQTWGGMLCGAGVATITARWRMSRARTDEGLMAASRLEVVGMLAFATALGAYGLAAVALGRRGLPAGPMLEGSAVAFLVRARIIVVQLADLRGVLHTGTGDG